MSSWGEWSPCDRSCAGGQQARRRTMLHTAIHGGTCPHTHESRVCNNFKCPIDCLVTSWTAFSACSKTCNVGRKVRTRSVFRQAAHGGMACPVLNQTAPCETGVLCAVDCAVSSWSSWPKCSKSCGHGGVQSVRQTLRVAMVVPLSCHFEWRRARCLSQDAMSYKEQCNEKLAVEQPGARARCWSARLMEAWCVHQQNNLLL